MRLIAAGFLAALAVAAWALWSGGAFGALAWWALQQQRAFQAALAGAIQALRAGEPAALASLLGLCAAYGFLHAVGPGHGKLLVAGAAVGTRATALRMGLIAVAGSMAQAVVAILAVYGAFLVFQASARGAADVDAWLEPLAGGLIALIGGWLLVRGLGGLAGLRRAGCGHAHGPTAAEAARASGLGAALALVGAMAVRPCTGALVVLVVAWSMDLAAAGAAAAVAMGLGTAAFTVLVAVAAVTSRDAAFLTAGDGPVARLLSPALQVLAGGAILAIGTALAYGALAA